MMMKSIIVMSLALTSLPFHDVSADSWTRYGGPHGKFVAGDSISFNQSAYQPTLAWERTLGDGLSSLVADEKVIFATYLKPFTDAENEQPESQRTHLEAIAALDRSSGQTVWEFDWKSGWIDDQEAFGGRTRAPQATPLLHGEYVVTVGFTGWLHCLDRQSGRSIWNINLVERFAATPVQFGFAASPIMHEDRLIVLAGGQDGGLVCLDIHSGKVQWNVSCNEASYATPVVFEVENESHIVFVTRNNIIAVEANSGKERWRYELVKAGLTNVPTPISPQNGRLIISGQGIGGTRELIVAKEDDQWRVSEGWNNRSQFFYCNWLIHQNALMGFDDNLFVAIDVRTGETLGRWRGYENANLIRMGENLLILDGEGRMSIAQRQVAGLEILACHQVLEERCWAPPTAVGADAFCRGGKKIARVQLAQHDDTIRGEPLAAVQVKKSQLTFKGQQFETPEASTFVDQIVESFQNDGAEAAWKTYQAIRTEHGQDFSLDDREELAELAQDQGLMDFGKQLLIQAVEDFPNSRRARRLLQAIRKKLNPQPSKKTHVGENGLTYLELAIKNPTNKTIQTEVKGPGKHPFGYGIPFPAGKVRVEKWPVGTTLYETRGDKRVRVLIKVKESDAGQTRSLK